MKENVRNLREKLEEKQENMSLNSVNSREIPEYLGLKKITNKVFIEKSNCIVYLSNKSKTKK